MSFFKKKPTTLISAEEAVRRSLKITNADAIKEEKEKAEFCNKMYKSIVRNILKGSRKGYRGIETDYPNQYYEVVRNVVIPQLASAGYQCRNDRNSHSVYNSRGDLIGMKSKLTTTW